MHLQFTLCSKVKGITIEMEYKTPITRHGKATQRNKNKQNDDDFKKWKRKEKNPNESINSKSGAWTNRNSLFFLLLNYIMFCFCSCFGLRCIFNRTPAYDVTDTGKIPGTNIIYVDVRIKLMISKTIPL